MSALTKLPDPPHWTAVDWDDHLRDEIVNRRRIRYVDLGEGDGLPLLLVHGTGGSWQSWLLNLGDLSRHRRVIAVDLPGFGASEALGPPAGMTAYADAVVTFLDRLGIDKAILVGHSLGGIVVLRAALRHPDRVESLVIVDGGGVALSPRRLAAVTLGLRAMTTAFRSRPLVQAMIRRPRLRHWLLARAMHDTAALTPDLASVMLAAFAAPGVIDAIAAGARDDIAAEVDRIEAPILLVWGRHDRILPLALAEDLALRVPQMRLEIVEDAGHCPMIERPDTFNRLIESWVNANGR